MVGEREGGREGDVDVVRDDKEAGGVTGEDVEDGGKWRDRIRCGDP